MADVTRYTLFEGDNHIDHEDTIVHRGLTLAEVSKAVREHDGNVAYIYHRDYPSFRAFELRKNDQKGKLKVVIGATVPATGTPALDREKAEEMIDIQVVTRCHDFCKWRVLTDAEYDKRVATVVERRAARVLERKITTELIDRLLEEGYRITACARWDHPHFKNSRRRDGILKLLFDLEIADLVVSKKGETSWVCLIFGEDGWDTITDYSTDLSYLIDPIVDPHLPWNKPGSKDRGYTIFTLPSPEQAESVDPEARDKVDAFFSVMDKALG
jgi:hypothetical protein